MVGMGRPFMFANCFGVDGVRKAIQILKNETVHDGAQAGVTDLRNVSSKVVGAAFVSLPLEACLLANAPTHRSTPVLWSTTFFPLGRVNNSSSGVPEDLPSREEDLTLGSEG